MIRVEFSEDAERDLIEIYLYGIQHFGAQQADAYAARLDKALQLAAENPSFGADYGFVRPGLRRMESRSHAIYYYFGSNRLLVLRILHGRMDPGRHLS